MYWPSVFVESYLSTSLLHVGFVLHIPFAVVVPSLLLSPNASSNVLCVSD